MKIALLGFGTVGSGVYEILNSETMRNQDVSVKAILVREVEKYRHRYGDQLPFVSTMEEILRDSEIDLVVEVMGGIEVAFEYITASLRKKKHVVTANKAVLAAHMEKLTKLAEQNEVSLLYEASVGGGIPLIRPLACAAQMNSFSEVAGILNGTSNYILTKMSLEGLSFEEALHQAQEAGFAEADPTDDIDGPDVARKISVLTSTIMGCHLPVEAIWMDGIRHIQTEDMRYAEKQGCVIKLIGRAKRSKEGFYALVGPELVSSSALMAQVNYEFNLGVAKGDFLREVSFYGEGAGKQATASAVIADILDILGAGGKRVDYRKAIDFKQVEVTAFPAKYYLRLENQNDTQAERLLAGRNYRKVEDVKGAYIVDGNDGQQMERLMIELRRQGVIYFKAKI